LSSALSRRPLIRIRVSVYTLYLPMYIYTYERVRKTSGRAVFVRRTIALKCKCNTNSPLKLPNAYTYHIITIIFTAGYTNTTLVYAPETVAVYTRYRYRCGRYVYEWLLADGCARVGSDERFVEIFIRTAGYCRRIARRSNRRRVILRVPYTFRRFRIEIVYPLKHSIRPRVFNVSNSSRCTRCVSRRRKWSSSPVTETTLARV